MPNRYQKTNSEMKTISRDLFSYSSFIIRTFATFKCIIVFFCDSVLKNVDCNTHHVFIHIDERVNADDQHY